MPQLSAASAASSMREHPRKDSDDILDPHSARAFMPFACRFSHACRSRARTGDDWSRNQRSAFMICRHPESERVRSAVQPRANARTEALSKFSHPDRVSLVSRGQPRATAYTRIPDMTTACQV